MTTSTNWNWGMPEDKFPSLSWDKFDGEIDLIEYSNSEFENDDGEKIQRAQIHIVVRPEEYEYVPRDQEYDENQVDGLPQGFYSMGGGKYRFSDDNYDIRSGPTPLKTTRAFKLIKGLQTHSDVKLTNNNLQVFEGVKYHWEATIEKGNIRGEPYERAILYPVSEVIGKSVYGDEDSAPSRSGRRNRRNRATEEASNESVDTNTNNDESTEEQPTSTRRRRRSQESEESTNNSSNGEVDYTEAIKLIVQVVAEREDNGLRASRLNGSLTGLEGEAPDDLIAQATEEGALNLAIEQNLIVRDGSMLYTPEFAE